MTHINFHGLSAATLFDCDFFFFFLTTLTFSWHGHRKHTTQGTNKENLCIWKWWNHFSKLKSLSLKCNAQGREEGQLYAANRHGGQKASAALSHRVEDKQEPLMETSSFHYTSICSSQQYLLAAAHMVPWDRQADRQRDRRAGSPWRPGKMSQNIWICSVVLCTSENVIDISD